MTPGDSPGFAAFSRFGLRGFFFGFCGRSLDPFEESVSDPSYLPTRYRLSQEIIATTVGVLVAAYIISKVPKFKELIDGSSIWSTEQSIFNTPAGTP